MGNGYTKWCQTLTWTCVVKHHQKWFFFRKICLVPTSSSSLLHTHTKTREKTVTMLVKCFTTLVAVCSKSGKNYALRIQNMYFLRLMCCVWCYFLHTLLPQHNETSIHFKPITLANELSSWEEKKPELCDKEASFFTFAYKFLCWRHNFVRSRLLLFGRLAFFLHSLLRFRSTQWFGRFYAILCVCFRIYAGLR